MDKIFKIAAENTTFIGFITTALIVLYGIYRLIIKSDKLSTIKSTDTFKLVKIIINYVFIIVIFGMIIFLILSIWSNKGNNQEKTETEINNDTLPIVEETIKEEPIKKDISNRNSEGNDNEEITISFKTSQTWENLKGIIFNKDTFTVSYDAINNIHTTTLTKSNNNEYKFKLLHKNDATKEIFLRNISNDTFINEFIDKKY